MNAPQLDLVQQLIAAASTFRGVFATETALTTAHPADRLGAEAWVTATSSYWMWNAAATTPGWVNTEIEYSDWQTLPQAEQEGGVKWSIIADTP